MSREKSLPLADQPGSWGYDSEVPKDNKTIVRWLEQRYQIAVGVHVVYKMGDGRRLYGKVTTISAEEDKFTIETPGDQTWSWTLQSAWAAANLFKTIQKI